MPTPATTGQLRAKVSEMEIGDYISLRTSFNSNTQAALKEMGWDSTNALPEVSVSGQVSGASLKLFMVKVARGLLVSDRVIQHSISWDVLNSAKYIQGQYFNNGNIIPIMTSNTSPSGVASASSVASSQRGAYQAFDGKLLGANNEVWYTTPGQTTGWLSYEFPSEARVTGYSVTCGSASDTSASSPKDWTFEGWNGTEWVVLDSQNSQINWAEREKRIYLFSNKNDYIAYRINVSSNNGHTNYLSIGELEMFDTVGTIRSLTGGVAYADANGDKIRDTHPTNNSMFGAFPTNNEWDKYIVKFPQELIQSGKTIDDVFHCSGGVNTWVQDTVDTTLNAPAGLSGFIISSSGRIQRGDAGNPIRLWGTESSHSAVSIGFRPVFEYKEK
jgi:hypothetical protein